MVKFSLSTWILVYVGLAAMIANSAESDKKPIREIFVPFDDLNVLLQGDAERTFLTREEYEELIEKAKQTPKESAPHDVLLLSADYDVTIEDERAAIRGTLWIEVLESGLHAIPLELNGVGIHTVMLDETPASLGRDANGQVILFVSDQGKKRLDVELVTTLQTSAAQQSLHFTLPTPAATKLRLSVPGNVEVRSGAAVVSRNVDEDAGVTRFELLPNRGPMSLVMSLNNKLLLERRVVMARSVIVDEMTQAYERLHATVSLGVLHGAVDRFRFQIPIGFEVTAVDAPTLARWQVRDEADVRTLQVDLREPTTGMVVLNVSAINNTVERDDWQMPRLEPLDVSNHVAVVGMLLEDRLAADSIAAGNLIPIDTDVLRQALPESVFRTDPGAPRIRPIAAFYAPQDQYQLTARFTHPPGTFDAHLSMLLTLNEKQQHVRGTITLLPSQDKLFAIDVAVPSGWRVAGLNADDGTAIPFERIATDEEGPARLHVKLPAGIAPGSVKKLILEATSVPNGWLDTWDENSATFPNLSIMGVGATTGAVVVQSRDDLASRPDQLTGLTVLSGSERAALGLEDTAGTLVYRINDTNYSASFIVERVTPRITARTFSFFKIEPEGLKAHYEIVYDVQQARTRELRFRLPESTPTSLSVRGLDSAAVKEYSNELVDGERYWTVLLADSTQGRIRLAIDFEQPPADDEPRNWELPSVHAVNVAYQSAVVAVEGSPEFDAQVTTNGRKIDVGELVDADYQVGRRLLGAFGFVDDPQVTVDIFQRPGYGLPAAITQQAELVTLVAAAGNHQTAARYLLRTKAAFLQISLPPEATLWSATVDGTPATPQRDGDALVISLPPTSSRALRDLQIVYESTGSSLDWMADVKSVAPRLVVRMDNDDDRYEVPIADLQWHLVLPAGHQVVRNRGTVFTNSLPLSKTPLSTIGRIVYRLGGGVGEFGILPGMLLSNRQAARIAADYATENNVQAIQDAEELSMFAESTAPLADRPATATTAPAASEPRAGAADAPSQPNAAEGGEVADADRTTADGMMRARENRAAKYWALQGVRSLRIDLDRSGPQITFQSMGVRPTLRATLVNTNRMLFLSWTLALITAVWGISKTNQSVRNKVRFVLIACALAMMIPLIVGLLSDITTSMMFVPMLYAAILLIPYYIVAGAAGWVSSKVTSRRVSTTTAASAATLLLLLSGSPLMSQENESRPAIDPADLLLLLQPERPIKLPADAVIIPYDPEQPNGVEQAEKVLVPYAEYTRLWNLAFPNKPLHIEQPPAPYALADAAYTTTLADDNYLVIQGRMDLDVYQQSPIEVPLNLAGGVLERVTLDGKPAHLRIISPQPTLPNQQTQQEAQPGQARADAFALLHVTSPGRKHLELAIRIPIAGSGGWRTVHGRLPAAPATRLTLTVPAAQTDVRLSGTFDRANFETIRPNESIVTALPPEGDFGLQWRPTVTAGQVDQTLTVRSTSVLDIQEDGVRLAWQLKLQTRNNQRETFTFVAPKEYLVEQVSGDNVRGWQSRTREDEQQIDVTLLKAAAGTETITLRLSRRGVIGLDGDSTLTAPVVAVPDAVLHQGQLAVRRSPLLDVRTEQTSALTRIELSSETMDDVLKAVDEESPLGLKPYEAYRFGSSAFDLQLAVRSSTSRLSVEERTVLRIGERETAFETRLKLMIADRPMHRIEVELPLEFELREVVAPGAIDWAVTNGDDSPLLTIYLAAGVVGQLDVDLRGDTPRVAGTPVSSPRFNVRNTGRQSGHIVVQADPSVDVTTDQAENIEEVPVSQVAGWLAASQRTVTRLVIFHRSAEYSVRFQISPRQAKVNVFSVTNVRVTAREIEESVLLKFSVRDAGIREVSFLLPASLRDSRITVPLLRQKTVTPVEDDASQVRVRLELQDQVIDELIVLVEHSRSLSSDDYTAPIPTIKTGTTDFRYVVIEGAGRDEVIVTGSDGFLELNRRLSQWKQLAGILPGNITQAYVARETNEQPRLSLETRRRATVETAGAGIGIAQTLLLVDANGAYRGLQEYRVDNKTEQYLEIELPEGAALWTVLVAGEPVKPTVVPTALNNRLVRVPLIKTQTGDLDYSVVLKYGGDLNQFRSLRQIHFPLMKTININVEQSHVRLRLPESQRWFNFNGSMRQVTDAGELAADYVSYQTKQVQRLMQVFNSDSYDAFSKLRAGNNVKLQVEQSGLQSHGLLGDMYGSSDNQRLQSELQSNLSVVEEAEKQIQQLQQPEPEASYFSNGLRFRRLYDQQSANRANDVVSDLDNNFDTNPAERDEKSDGEQRFNRNWFRSNQLGRGLESKDAVPNSRIASNPKNAPLSQRKQQLEADFLGGKKGAQKPSDDQQKRESVDDVSQLERYQQRLESQNEANQLGRYSRSGLQPPAQGQQGRDYAGFEMLEEQMLQRDLSDEAESQVGGGMGGGGFGGGMGFAAPFGENSQPGSGSAIPQSAGTIGLSSIDVDLPDRGVEYLFTTPRGDLRITAQSVPAVQVNRTVNLASILLLLIGITIVYRIGRVLIARISRRILALIVILLGIASVVVGVLPVLGLFMIAGGIFLATQPAIGTSPSPVQQAS